jgi:hypothetical protein
MNDELYDLVVESNKRLRMDVIKLTAERDALVQQRNEALDGVEVQMHITAQVADDLVKAEAERSRWREVATGLANTVKTLAGAECELDPDEDSPPEWRDVIAVVAAFDELKAKEN